jgi:hypothetical protein
MGDKALIMVFPETVWQKQRNPLIDANFDPKVPTDTIYALIEQSGTFLTSPWMGYGYKKTIVKK